MNRNILGKKAVKINSEPGDGHHDGATCIIIAESPDTPYGIIYLTIFEDFPLPVAIAGFRVKFLTPEDCTQIQLTDDQVEYLSNFPEKMFKYYYDEEPEKAQNHKKN